jgi:tetratricopeptide (TPR) repeat protein
MRVHLKIFPILWCFVAAPAVIAEDMGKVQAPTAAEIAKCKKRMDRLNSKELVANRGNHYCDGLRFYDRALISKHSPGKEYFGFYINQSLANFEYALKIRSPMDSELLVMKGRTLELADRSIEAIQMYHEALKINPRFSMAYAALGNFLAKTGDKPQALKVYSDGLRRNPNNRYLLARYKALGGDPGTLHASEPPKLPVVEDSKSKP